MRLESVRQLATLESGLVPSRLAGTVRGRSTLPSRSFGWFSGAVAGGLFVWEKRTNLIQIWLQSKGKLYLVLLLYVIKLHYIVRCVTKMFLRISSIFALYVLLINLKDANLSIIYIIGSFHVTQIVVYISFCITIGIVICDMIERNESDVGNIGFEILAKTVFQFLCFILFLALTNSS